MLRFLLLLCLFASCNSRPEVNERLKGNITMGMPAYFIHNASARVYQDSSEKSKLLKTLRQLDSAFLEIAEPVLLNEWYKVFFHTGDSGYIKGNELASGYYADLDNDNVQELLLYGYDDYHSYELESGKEDNDAFLKYFKAAKLQAEYRFKASDQIELNIFEEMGFEPELKIVGLAYGDGFNSEMDALEMVYLNAGQFHKIFNFKELLSEEELIEYELCFPIDSGGSPNKLKAYRNRYFEDNNGDEATLSDTLIFAYNGQSFPKVLETNHKKSR